MFSKYYLSELTYLRDLGKEFAAANPSLAAMFAERGGDPDVERLLEGFAFLSARTRERIDDAVPEFIDAMCSLAIPQFVQPTPAATIIEFTPSSTALRSRQRIPAGTELGSKPVDGSPCFFKTTGPVDLLPLTISGTQLDTSREASPAIRISFRTQDVSHAAALEEGLRLYVNGPWALASMITYWIARHLERIEYRSKNGEVRNIAPKHARIASLDMNEQMLPWPDNAPSEMRLLQELFTLPQRMLFVHLDGFKEANLTPTSEFEVTLHFKKPPILSDRVEKDLFRLHCVPAVNRFTIGADPISKDARIHEYLVRAAGFQPRHAEVADVRSVTGIRQKGARLEYTPFFSFLHALRPPEDQAYFVLRRTHSPLDNAYDTYLSVLSPRGGAAMTDDEVLSIELDCTNRQLPAQLRVGDVNVALPRSPSIAKFTNISQVSKPVRSQLGSDLHWRLVAHLALNQRSLSNPELLRSLLSLYNFQQEADQQAGRANKMRIDAIRSIDLKSSKAIVERVPTRGLQSLIELDEAGFASLGDMFLFASALDAFFGNQSPINTFHRLKVRAHPSNEEISWPARTGLGPIF